MSRLALEPLEERSQPAANLRITDALLVDPRGMPIAAPVNGEKVCVWAEWTTTDLTSADSYVVRYWVGDGVAAGFGNAWTDCPASDCGTPGIVCGLVSPSPGYRTRRS